MLSTEVRPTAPPKGNLNGKSGSRPNVKNGAKTPSPKVSQLNLNQSPVQILEDSNEPKNNAECDSSTHSREINEGVMVTYDLTGIKCAGVNYDGKELWKRDSTDPNAPYPVSAFFVVRGATAFVVFKESMNILRLTDDGWKTVLSGKAEPLQLDSRSKSSNKSFEYVKKGDVHTFTVKGKHLFSGFIKSGRCLQPDTPIWTPGFSDEFATKIVYNKTNSSNKILEIYQVNGLIKKYFKKSGFLGYKVWKESWSWTNIGTWKEFWTWRIAKIWKKYGIAYPGNELMPEKVEILTERQSTAPQTRTETPKTTITTKSATESTESSAALSSDVDTEEDIYLKYAFEYGVKCVQIKYDDKLVWKYDASKPNASYPVSVVFVVKGATAFVNFIGYRMILRLENGEWKIVFAGTEDLESINVQSKNGCDNYGCLESNKVYTYTPKKNTLFNKVGSQVGNGKEEIIFETLAILDVVNKLVYDESDPNNLAVTLHHVDGVARKLVKSSGAKWKESSATDSGFELEENKVEFVIQYQHAIQKPEKADDQSTPETNVSEGQVAGEQEPDSDTKDQDGTPVPPGTYDTLPSGRTRVDLDIRTRASTNQFEYSQSYGFWTYAAKDGHYFASVRDGNAVVYKRSIAGSPVKVIAEVDASLSLVGLTLNIISKEIRRFKVSDGNLQRKG